MLDPIQEFMKISKIPRCSKKEIKIRNYLINWAQVHNFKFKVDSVGNLFIYVPGTNENSNQAVMLQSHMDMVCVKNPGSSHNFDFDEIKIIEKDGFLMAQDTTLGADNGIGMALNMSVVEFPNRPNLELVFTVDEEDGMSGALNMDFSLSNAKYVINLDMESQDQICISSAGGVGISLTKELLPISTIEKNYYEIELFGFKGGHSGVDIDKNRGNPIMILMNFLTNSEIVNSINFIESGSASNVIPSKAKAVILGNNIDQLSLELKDYIELIKSKYDCPEANFSIQLFSGNINIYDNIKPILNTLIQVDDGVYSMSKIIPNLVQTSMNLGVIKIENNSIICRYLFRSSDAEEHKSRVEFLLEYFKSNNFSVSLDRGYLGWQDDPNSRLVQIVKKNMEKEIGGNVSLIAIHAGLECGTLVAGLGKGVNAVSIGPNIFDVHSVDEKVQIESVYKIYNSLKGILSDLAS